MPIIEIINEGIKDAMRSRDSLRLNTLRMLKSKILNVNARGDVPDVEVIKLFKTYLGNLQEALEQAIAVNRMELAEPLKGEIAIVQEFLPKALTEEETEKLVAQAMIDSGAKSKKDFGLVMKALIKLNSGVDGKLAKKYIDPLLQD